MFFVARMRLVIILLQKSNDNWERENNVAPSPACPFVKKKFVCNHMKTCNKQLLFSFFLVKD